MSEMQIESASDVTLPPEQRAALRDWFDESGYWAERMTALYRLVERMLAERAELAWEQGWVARGNHWDVEANPYTTPTTDPNGESR